MLKRLLLLISLVLITVAAGTAQCGSTTVNPFTGKVDCIGNNSAGPTGPTGATGPTGPTGPSGAAATTRTWLYTFQGAAQAAGTGFSLNLPNGSSPTLANAGGTMPIAILQYPTAQSTYYAWATFILPAGYVSNAAITYSVESTCDVATTCDSTHASKVFLGLACSGSVVNAPTVTDASSFNVTNAAAGAPTTTTGTITPNAGGLPTCAAGQRAWIRIKVDTNTNSLTGPFNMSLFSVSVTGSI